MMIIDKLGKFISEVSVRNKNGSVTNVFSVTNSKGFIKSTDYFSKEVFSKDITNYKIVGENEFAYNPSRINVGSIDYLKQENEVAISPLYVVFRCSKELNVEYLKVFLKSPIGNTRIRAKTKGAVRDSLSFGSLCEIKVPIFPVDQQLHIANLLSKAENLISQRKESIRLLGEFLKSTFLEMFGDPIANRLKWPLLHLSDFGESRLGKMLDGKKIIGNNLKPYLRNSNVLWFSFKLDDLLEMDFDEKDRVEFSLRNGDVLMCEGGEIGRCAIWRDELEEYYFQKAIHRIRLEKKIALPEYFVYMFWLYTLNGGLKKYMGAATISHLTGEKLKKLKLPIPPIGLQTQFAHIVEKTEALKAQYQQSLKELENLYGSLSQRAFRGELGVKEDGL